MPDNLAHRDLLRRFGKNEPAISSCDALHDTQMSQVNHDLFEEAAGNIIPFRNLPDRDWPLTVMLHQREQRSQSII